MARNTEPTVLPPTGAFLYNESTSRSRHRPRLPTLSRSNPLTSYIQPQSCTRTAHQTNMASTNKVSTWDRNIICLPHTLIKDNSVISIPCGHNRSISAAKGLTGKVRFNSNMAESELMAEIRSVFRGLMGEENDFPFHILQPNGVGTKTLGIPSTSIHYQWTPREIAK